MGISHLKNVSKIVSFTIDSQNVAGGANYTKVIAVGEGWEVARVTFWAKDVLPVPTNVKRISAYIILTDDYNDAYSQAVRYVLIGVKGYSGITYYLPNYKYSGFSYATDSKLSDPGFDTTGKAIRLIRGKINNADVELEFNNTSAVLRTLHIEGRIRLSKDVLL